ncbi:hypothetical protein F4679DRAFT_221819 [Xylaria curta]|nr:hypothetical protein F4679DRAFT_221819 [Xylaria curta]
MDGSGTERPTAREDVPDVGMTVGVPDVCVPVNQVSVVRIPVIGRLAGCVSVGNASSLDPLPDAGVVIVPETGDVSAGVLLGCSPALADEPMRGVLREVTNVDGIGNENAADDPVRGVLLDGTGVDEVGNVSPDGEVPDPTPDPVKEMPPDTIGSAVVSAPLAAAVAVWPAGRTRKWSQIAAITITTSVPTCGNITHGCDHHTPAGRPLRRGCDAFCE